MNWLFLVTLLQVSVTSDEEVLITISGSSRIDILNRDGAIPELRAALNESGGHKSESLVRGEANLYLDVDLGNELRLALDLEVPAWDDNEDLPFSRTPFTDPLRLDKLYLDTGGFLSPNLALRLGLQDFSYRLRPAGEPFFMGTGMSEPFFSGTSSFVRNTADRDRFTPGGISLRYNPNLALQVEFWWATMVEGGPTHDDETLTALFLNGLLSERTSWNLVTALVTGNGSDREIWTVGMGLDHYTTPSRSLELFFEGYLQFGSLDEATDREAGAVLCGVAWYGDGFWIEAAFSLRSGDDDPLDGTEKTFQSCEDVNQFAIVESASLGLDIDTNVGSFRLAGEVTITDNLFLRLDAGRFRFHEKVRNVSGAVLAPSRDLGVELDITLRHEINPLVGASITFAALHSDFLDEITGESTTALVVSGVQIRF